jgi:hypothetical protein
MFRAAPLIIAGALSAHFSAQAQLLAAATLEGTYSQPVDSSSWHAIFLSAGATALNFDTTTNNERVVITYSGTCLALNFTVFVRAKIDGVVANPGTAGGIPLCSTDLNGSTYPASRAFSALILTTGAHTVTFEVKKGNGGGAAILIGDSALAVQH